jgi:hypothetical protein
MIIEETVGVNWPSETRRGGIIIELTLRGVLAPKGCNNYSKQYGRNPKAPKG